MAAKPKRGRGRPSLYTAALAKEIVERLSNGEPLAQICRDDHMPDDDTVRNWGKVDETFSRSIACARETGFDVIASNARQVARGLGESTGDVQRDKLIIETDLKLLAKWDPKRYGDRVALDANVATKLLPASVDEFVECL